MAAQGSVLSFLLLFITFAFLITAALSTSLSPNYYHKSCPHALPTIKRVVEAAVNREKRMGASLLRLHFHDCFVNGCDGSVLLDATSTIDSEKNALANNNSARGFDVIDEIKREVDEACKGPVVSCADILAVAARDSVVTLGGPSWKVQLGRRDSTTASRTRADNDIPAPFMQLPALLDSFRRQGLDARDLVALSGAHTLGKAQCQFFRPRIYGNNGIDAAFARARRSTCPPNGSGGDRNLAPLDPTAAKFDTAYFENLLKNRGLLTSDQALFSGGATDELVRRYAADGGDFAADFARSMVKMANIKPLTGSQGQVRLNCRRVN